MTDDQADILEDKPVLTLGKGEGEIGYQLDEKEYSRYRKLEEALTLSQIVKNLKGAGSKHNINTVYTILEKVLDDLLAEEK